MKNVYKGIHFDMGVPSFSPQGMLGTLFLFILKYEERPLHWEACGICEFVYAPSLWQFICIPLNLLSCKELKSDNSWTFYSSILVMLIKQNKQRYNNPLIANHYNFRFEDNWAFFGMWNIFIIFICLWGEEINFGKTGQFLASLDVL